LNKIIEEIKVVNISNNSWIKDYEFGVSNSQVNMKMNSSKLISFRFIQFFFTFLFLFTYSCARSSISVTEETSDFTLNNTCTISGYISDRDTKEHLIGASVLLNDGIYETGSDINGFFSFNNILPGKYKVTAKYIGYETYSKSNVKLKGNFKYGLNIELWCDCPVMD